MVSHSQNSMSVHGYNLSCKSMISAPESQRLRSAGQLLRFRLDPALVWTPLLCDISLEVDAWLGANQLAVGVVSCALQRFG